MPTCKNTPNGGSKIDSSTRMMSIINSLFVLNFVLCYFLAKYAAN